MRAPASLADTWAFRLTVGLTTFASVFSFAFATVGAPTPLWSVADIVLINLFLAGDNRLLEHPRLLPFLNLLILLLITTALDTLTVLLIRINVKEADLRMKGNAKRRRVDGDDDKRECEARADRQDVSGTLNVQKTNSAGRLPRG